MWGEFLFSFVICLFAGWGAVVVSRWVPEWRGRAALVARNDTVALILGLALAMAAVRSAHFGFLPGIPNLWRGVLYGLASALLVFLGSMLERRIRKVATHS